MAVAIRRSTASKIIFNQTTRIGRIKSMVSKPDPKAKYITQEEINSLFQKRK